MKTREELIEVMAEANHTAWRDEWIKLGEVPESIPTWQTMPAQAKDASRSCQAAILTAIESNGAMVVPVEATDEMCEAAWENPSIDYIGEHKVLGLAYATYTAMLNASPFKPEK